MLTTSFVNGFEKAAEANGLAGVMKNMLSGNRAYSKGGAIKAPSTIKPGEVTAPRSDMPPISTMGVHSVKHNLDAALPFTNSPNVKVKQPKGVPTITGNAR